MVLTKASRCRATAVTPRHPAARAIAGGRGGQRRPNAQPQGQQAAGGRAECPRYPMSVHHGLQSHVV